MYCPNHRIICSIIKHWFAAWSDKNSDMYTEINKIDVLILNKKYLMYAFKKIHWMYSFKNVKSLDLL